LRDPAGSASPSCGASEGALDGGDPLSQRGCAPRPPAHHPHAGWIDPALVEAWQPLLRVGGWATIALELSAPLLLTRPTCCWAVPGALMHLGFALTMGLGMCCWGMRALYPPLFCPWLQAPADRLEAALGRGAARGVREG
jgi:hypothetical protein